MMRACNCNFIQAGKNFMPSLNELKLLDLRIRRELIPDFFERSTCLLWLVMIF